MNDPQVSIPEVMLPSALESQTRAEVDIQIATAHRFPRVLSRFFAKAQDLATATPEIAASMEYAKPVGGDRVKGPSARLAEIVAATYGNLRVSARVISETETEIVAQGVAHDLESNTAQSTEVTVSILKKDGKRFGPDQVATMRGAACSKARRNAVFLAVPVALCMPIIAAARKVSAGDEKTVPQRRKDLLDWFEKKGVKRSAIFAWLEVKSETDIGLDQMADLIAANNSAKEDGVDLSSIFAAPKDPGERFSGDMGAKKVEPSKTGPKPVTMEELQTMVQRATAATSAEEVLAVVLEKGGKKNPAEVAEADRGKVLVALQDLAGL